MLGHACRYPSRLAQDLQLLPLPSREGRVSSATKSKLPWLAPDSRGLCHAVLRLSPHGLKMRALGEDQLQRLGACRSEAPVPGSETMSE